jgi:hypothetical protein
MTRFLFVRTARRWIAASSVLIAAGVPATVRADGAFPDSMQILLPSDKPQRIVLATNFGLVISEDDGATWHLVCEQAIAPYVSLYQLGPPPVDTLFAVLSDGLAFSSDLFCSQSVARGAFAGSFASDVFPDPADPLHVFVIGKAAATSPYAVFASADGAFNFGSASYAAPTDGVITGVEVASSDPQKVYLTMYVGNPPHPYLLRSTDRGASFLPIDEQPSIGSRRLRLAGVDPTNAQRVYLRVIDGAGDRLGITDDAGATIRIALILPNAMSMFFRRSDGALVVGTPAGAVYLSINGGATFAPWTTAPHLRAMGERNGNLYAVSDNFTDGFAVGVSIDLGATWRPLLRFQDIAGVAGCGQIPAVCKPFWDVLHAQLEAASVDGGGTVVDAGPATPPKCRGCGCAGEDATASTWLVVVLLGSLTRTKRTARCMSPRPGR